MARKNAAVRREEILGATIEEIEATGLRTLRVADVADRLGLSASLIIYHFETKEALVAAAFAHAGQHDIDRARELADTSAPAGQRLREVIAWYMPTGSTRSWRIWIDGWAAGLFDAELKSTFAGLDRQWKAILAELIVASTRSAHTGEQEADTAAAVARPEAGGDHAEACATRILAYLDGLAVQMLFNPETVTRPTLHSWVEDFLAHELRRVA